MPAMRDYQAHRPSSRQSAAKQRREPARFIRSVEADTPARTQTEAAPGEARLSPRAKLAAIAALAVISWLIVAMPIWAVCQLLD